MIKTISNLFELIEYIEQPLYTTVMFDIDDTLITTKNHNSICPNRNFRNRLIAGNFRYKPNGQFASYCNKDYLKIVNKFNREITEVKWKLTQEDIPFLLGFLNRNQIKYLYFTARGTEIHKETRAILRKLKIYPRYAPNRVINIPNVTGRSGIRGNIIYAGGYDKCNLLCDLGYKIHQTLIMIDDSKSNLESFENYFKDSKLVKFIGLHYVRK